MIFVPDDPILALVQSSLDAYFDRDLEGRTVEAVDLSTDLGDNRRGGSAVDPILYDEGLRPDSPDKRRLFGKFEMTDPGWIASFFALQLRRFTDKHPFNPSPADSVMLADRTRIVLVGDWGSGVPRARQVATHMRRHIDDAIGDGVAVHVVHLGDVYYSGLPREYEKRFLAHWPVRMDEADAIGSWCLNANHDMYSGGYGYFDHLLADARFAGHRDSSWFVLENEHWRFVGLDTAWDEEGLHDKRKDRGLQDPQADVVNGYAADEPSLVLLSHHPLFSAYKPDDAFLRRKLATAIDQDKVRAWFWGHEHRAVAYEGHDHVAFGRCVGSGGVPVWKQTYDHPATSPSILWREQRFHDLLIEDFTYFGFAVVDLEGPSMTVTYYDEENSPSYAETISA